MHIARQSPLINIADRGRVAGQLFGISYFILMAKIDVQLICRPAKSVNQFETSEDTSNILQGTAGGKARLMVSNCPTPSGYNNA